MGLKNEVGRANLLFSAGRMLSSAIMFLLSVYLARLLQPYEFGIYSFAMVIIGIAAIFTDFGINTVLFKFGSERQYQEDRSLLAGLVRITFRYKVLLSLLVGGLMVIFSGPIAILLGKSQTARFVILSGIIVLFISISEYLFYFFMMMKSFRHQSIFRVVESFLKAALVLIFLFLGFKAYGALLGTVISSFFLSLLLGAFILWKYHAVLFASPKEPDRSILSRFAVWSALGLLLSVAYNTIDQLMISRMMPVESVGFYRLAYSWAFAISYLIPLAPHVMLTYYSDNLESKEHLAKMISNSIKYVALLSFPFSFLLSAFSGAFILLMYGSSYLPAAAALKILSLMIAPAIFSTFFQIYFISINRQDISIKIFGAMAAVIFLLDLFIIPVYGILGAAYVALFAKLLEFFALSYILFFREKIRFSLGFIWKPMVASAAVYAFLEFFLSRIFKEITLANFIFFGSMAFLTYLLFMLLAKGITKEDIEGIMALFRR